eukprot:2330380-Pyramimonas_sp.AAC.1
MDRRLDLQIDWGRERAKWTGGQGKGAPSSRAERQRTRDWDTWSWSHAWDGDDWQSGGKRGGDYSGDGRGDKRSRTWR